MSYILEALKKSEQARRQNTAARQYSLLPVIDEEMAAQRRWPYALAAALLVNAAVFFLWLRPTPPNHALAVKAPPVAQAVETPAANEADIAPSSAADKPAPAVVSAVPTAADVSRIRSGPATDTPAPRIVARAKALSMKTPKALERQSRPVSVQQTDPPPAAQPGRSAPTAVPENAKPAAAVTSTQHKEVAASGELPASLQKELPALSVAGFIRDKDSSGMVIVNDKLVREGDELAPGLKLEKIHDDSVVFSYKGHRFIR